MRRVLVILCLVRERVSRRGEGGDEGESTFIPSYIHPTQLFMLLAYPLRSACVPALSVLVK